LISTIASPEASNSHALFEGGFEHAHRFGVRRVAAGNPDDLGWSSLAMNQLHEIAIFRKNACVSASRGVENRGIGCLHQVQLAQVYCFDAEPVR